MFSFRSSRSGSRGFTMIELLIVIVIVGILARIAYPSYQSYVRASKRADAILALAQTQTILERCYALYFSYSHACIALPTFPAASPQGLYNVALSNLAVTTYTLTATPVGTQVADTLCASMSVNQANQRLATDTSGTNQSVCWSP